MNRRGLRPVALFAAAVLALAGAACAGSEGPTPIYLVRTPGPTPMIIYVTPTPNVSTTGTPGATFTLLPTPAPSVSPTPEASPSPKASPTATVSAGPTSPAAFCTGGAANQPEFVRAAETLKFDVYCGRLGKGWGLSPSPGMSWAATKSGGWLTITYKGPGSASVDVSEGAFCLTSPAACSPNTGNLGTGSFGGLSGDLDSTTDGFAIYVSPGTTHAYSIVGHNVSQSTLVSIGASLKVVPKS